MLNRLVISPIGVVTECLCKLIRTPFDDLTVLNLKEVNYPPFLKSKSAKVMILSELHMISFSLHYCKSSSKELHDRNHDNTS